MKKIVVVLLLLAYCFALGEAVIRFFYGPHRKPFYNYNMEMWRYAKDLKETLPSGDMPFYHYPDREGTYYGVTIKTNSLGFRDNEYPLAKPEGKKRILILGDSQTLGWGVPFESTFPKRLEAMLNEHGARYEVINTGIGNYNSAMEVALFKAKGLQLKPDMVILMYFINDTEPTPKNQNILVHALLEHSYFIAFLVERYEKMRIHFDVTFMHFDKEFDWRSYYTELYKQSNKDNITMNRNAVKELARLCRDRGIKLLIVNIPELHQLREYPFSFATEYIRSLARETQTPFLDLLPALAALPPESLWVSEEDDHANATTHSIIAAQLYRKIMSDPDGKSGSSR